MLFSKNYTRSSQMRSRGKEHLKIYDTLRFMLGTSNMVKKIEIDSSDTLSTLKDTINEKFDV